MAQEEIVHLNMSCVSLPSECSQGVRIAVTANLEDTGSFTEIGQTETVSNSVNPNFQREVPIVVRLDVNQQLKFLLYQVDAETEVFVKKIAEAEISLMTLITNPGNVALSLHSQYLDGFPHSPLLLVSAAAVESASRGTMLTFAGISLNPHTGFQVAPYFIIELTSSSPAKEPLRNGPKRKENASIELVQIRSREDTPSFVNLLKSGLQMHFTVAIDFTTNNGGPNTVNSLHFMHPHNPNVYMLGLSSICSSIFKFDKLGRISLLGFGAKTPPSFELSQRFALNGDLNNPHVKGINEVMSCYRNSAISLLPYAPTEYSAVIHHIVKLAKASLRTANGFYFTLIILTNGSIKNTKDTIDTIVQASELPISIVFVVLGNADIPIGTAGDASKLLHLVSPSLKSSKNIPLKREVVSLVVNNQAHAHPTLDSSSLAQKVLASIPRQVTLWELQRRHSVNK